MADKVYVTEGGGAGSVLITVLLIALIVGLGLLFFRGGLRVDRGKDVNVNIELPKAPPSTNP